MAHLAIYARHLATPSDPFQTDAVSWQEALHSILRRPGNRVEAAAAAASTSDHTHAWEFAASSWNPLDFSTAILFVHNNPLHRIIIMVPETQTIITLTTTETKEFHQLCHAFA